MADSPEDRDAIGKWASNYSTRFALGNSTSRTASGISGSGFYIEEGKRWYDPSISGLGMAKTHYRVDDEQMLRQGYTMQEIADEVESGNRWEVRHRWWKGGSNSESQGVAWYDQIELAMR
jgi:hypothetical protein